ncbi:MAG: Holliday junction branch migration protein RuvA [Clostridia bacterium]|nr:Holliday junction branch migration protein RuvA [Clostridia bacterium]MBQ2236735.1 Holliday junction branch migration protein RuvA [Clostridia bacterium]MEE1184866.1 Holliday junction branch migration protein RuvA [Acutalibacteraceae bacterium]
MLSTLRGKLLFNDTNSVIIECGGVGFKCFITKKTLSAVPRIGEELFLYTYLSVKEDALDLYGFAELEELEAYKLVTSVSGVGPKIGIALLSEFTASEISLYIASNDAKMLTRAAGVGLKLAQRIVLELKDKLGSFTGTDTDAIATVGNASINSNSKEAVAALVSLGFSQSEASLAIGKLDQALSAEELIKLALKTLSRGI